MTLPADARLGPYRVIDLLGAGGMGAVYRAHDERLQRDVAIKVLPADALADEEARRRFRREALALAKLSHSNIASVFDVGEDDGVPYLVMECVPGEPLSARIASAPLSAVEALGVATQIADALAEAHEHDVVHRDLKPANVMLTPKGQVKVLDFGLAKLLSPLNRSTDTLSRVDGGGGGTPLYMSPEQVYGETVDARTDIWSLGVVMFESLTGRTPFRGDTVWALLNAVSQNATPSLRSIRPEIPPAVEEIVSRALSKDPAARYPTAAAMRDDLRSVLQTLSGPAVPLATPRLRTKRIGLATLLALALIVGGGAWTVRRWSERNWARAEAPRAIARLEEADLPLAASSMLSRARQYLPQDTALAHLAATQTRSVTVVSSPSGADVAIQDYLTPDSAWRTLGTTPVKAASIPKGYFRWRVTPRVGKPMVVAPLVGDTMHFALDSAAAAPRGMVDVPAQTFGDYYAFIGWVGPYQMPPFYIGRYEVTNREYQAFVDSGGYRNATYWREPFVDAGKTWGRNEAMERFRDSTGRAGPSTWSGGHFPPGHGDDPVHGISWYEAAAYAAFRGDALPTTAQWHEAAPAEASRFVAALSNMSASHAAPVGTFPGVGPYGTYDMAGNAREWVYNANESGNRFIFGGGWSSPDYLYAEAEALPPFDRSPINGVRVVRNVQPPPAATVAITRTMHRDFTHVSPATDAVFNAYRTLYDYDSQGLDPRVEGIVQQTADWKLEKVTFNAAYNGERMAAYLYLPTHVHPPYQTVLFFPSARVLSLTDSRQLGDTAFFTYVVQSGRAVMYPVYQDTYERRRHGSLPGPTEERNIVIDRARDVGRSLDYLATRQDIDHARVAYMGVSMGAAEGTIFTTLQQSRLRAAIFLDGGYFLNPPPPGTDQADFVPRLKLPVLMVNGVYDQTFTYDAAQLPMFRMLGTAAADKKHVKLLAAHDVTSERPTLVREVLAWLDRYLGRVE